MAHLGRKHRQFFNARIYRGKMGKSCINKNTVHGEKVSHIAFSELRNLPLPYHSISLEPQCQVFETLLETFKYLGGTSRTLFVEQQLLPYLREIGLSGRNRVQDRGVETEHLFCSWK
jgi:hypothetical protein